MKNSSLNTNHFAAYLVLIIFALAAIKFFNISYPIKVINTTVSSELAVVGQGKVEVAPDTAYIDLGIVVNNAETVTEAQKQINETNQKIITALVKLGVDKKNIKTTNYSINPNYVYENSQSRIDGYNGNVTVEVKVKDTALAAKIIARSTEAGANSVEGTRFVVEDPAKYREQARNKAIDNAKEQAGKIAKNLGIRLGKVVNIVESSSNLSSYSTKAALPVYSSAGVGGTDESSAARFEAGTQTIYSTVTLYFAK